MRPALAENQLFSGIHGISQGDVHRLSVTAKALAQLHVVPEGVGVTGPDFR
ncbi:hypothetical protein SAMN04515657_2087 [Idiomarina abyssalis]|nr:hypothetical protein SAMN04515657_2087 [Idiomarina abyssalis]